MSTCIQNADVRVRTKYMSTYRHKHANMHPKSQNVNKNRMSLYSPFFLTVSAPDHYQLEQLEARSVYAPGPEASDERDSEGS